MQNVLIPGREKLSTALIQCYFDYSCSSWYSGLGSGLTKKLPILQNKVLRFVLDLGPRPRINCDILECWNAFCTRQSKST